MSQDEQRVQGQDLESLLDSAVPKSGPEEAPRMVILANILRKSSERMEELTNPERRIHLQEPVLSLVDNHLRNFGQLHLTRFEQLGELGDLNSLVQLQTMAISFTPQNHTDMPARLNNLGVLLETRFQQQDKLTDLEMAIEYKTQALTLTPEGHSEMPAQLSNLSCSLASRFKRLGDPADLDQAIEYCNKAVSLTPHDHPDISIRLNNLGLWHQCRFQAYGKLSELNTAVKYIRQAVSLTAPHHLSMPIRIGNLGVSLMTRFRRLDELSDLEEAIEYITLAVSFMPQGSSDMHDLLATLGGAFETRFERFGELEDLGKAIEYQSQALSLTPHGHSSMSNKLSNLGLSLEIRFERLGELADLDKSITYKSQAVLIAPSSHSDIPKWLNNLGSSLENRFERLGELGDIDKAVECMKKAVSLTQKDHPDMPLRLSNLAHSLQNRFHRFHELKDLEKAIEDTSKAVSLTPQDHADMHALLSNLGSLLDTRFELLDELVDLEKSIEHKNQALSLTPKGHSARPIRLNNLASSLLNRFERVGEVADLDKAIEFGKQAVLLTPKDHPEFPNRLTNLGMIYEARFDCLHAASDAGESLNCYEKAARSPVGRPFDKFEASLQWAVISVAHQRSSTLIAYRHAISFIPQIVWLGSAVGSRYRNIVDVGNVIAEAAAVAIKMNNFNLALEWLEEGRSIVWKQILQLRSPFDDLAVTHPELATQLQQVAHDLDQASSPQPVSRAVLSDDQSLEQAGQKHHRLAERWEELLSQARSCPGFELFLRSKKASDLMQAAQSGCVVIINTHDIASDALVLQPNSSEVLHVSLGLSFAWASQARITIEDFVHSRHPCNRYPAFVVDSPVELFKETLAVLWTDVVRPVLNSLGYLNQNPSTCGLPHITWCTSGPLSFLPIHAAGDYDSGAMIFNYVISSYTPTLSVLLTPPSTVFSGLLAVGQRSTLGMPLLPGTVKELNQIQQKSQGYLVTRLDEEKATPTAVLTGMENHSWVHLACHAEQQATDPMHSAFYLYSGTLNLASITQKQLKYADFAFLSACQTAMGDESLPEEAVHLAAGMLMAGYRTVIGTMWSIGDEDAPLVAEEVYGNLFAGERPDARRAAVALHKAMERLRKEVGVEAFAKWVPYIHIGL